MKEDLLHGCSLGFFAHDSPSVHTWRGFSGRLFESLVVLIFNLSM